MSEEHLLDILLRFSDYLNLSEVLRDYGRSFLNWFVGFLIWIVDNISGLLYETTQFLGFYSSATIGEQGLIGRLGYFREFSLGISILLVGGILFFGKTAETREVPLNFLLLLLLTLMLPGMMQQGMKIMHSTVSELQVEQEKLGFKTFKDNVTDIYVLAEHGWTITTPKPSNYLTDRDNFDINERVIIAPEGENGEPLKHKLIDKKASEGKEVIELEEDGENMFSGVTKRIFTESYYRWHIDWMPVIGTLTALALSLVVSVMRSCKLAIGLGFDYVWTNLVAYFSLRDTRKLKIALMNILGGYILLFSIFGMYYIFIHWNSYIFTQKDVSSLTKILGLLAGAWFIYDGPAIIQKTLGIDAGVSTAGAFLIGTGGMKMMKGAMELTKDALDSTVVHTVRGANILSELFSNSEKNAEVQGVNSEIEKEKKQSVEMNEPRHFEKNENNQIGYETINKYEQDFDLESEGETKNEVDKFSAFISVNQLKEKNTTNSGLDVQTGITTNLTKNKTFYSEENRFEQEPEGEDHSEIKNISGEYEKQKQEQLNNIINEDKNTSSNVVSINEDTPTGTAHLNEHNLEKLFEKGEDSSIAGEKKLDSGSSPIIHGMMKREKWRK